MPKQPFADPVDRGVRDAGEAVGEPRLAIGAVEFGGLNQGVGDGSGFSADLRLLDFHVRTMGQAMLISMSSVWIEVGGWCLPNDFAFHSASTGKCHFGFFQPDCHA